MITSTEAAIAPFTVQTSLLVPEDGVIGSRLVEVSEPNVRMLRSSELLVEKPGTWLLPVPVVPSKLGSSYLCESVEIFGADGDSRSRDYRYYEVGTDGVLVSMSSEMWSKLAEGEVTERVDRFGVVVEEVLAGPQRVGQPVRSLVEREAMLLQPLLLVEAGENKTEGVAAQGGVK